MLVMASPARREAMKRSGTRRPSSTTDWSAQVTKTSNALDLEPGVFAWKDPRRIARSLKRSAQASTRRNATPFQSAMSMLNFYLNRVGHKLKAPQRQILQQVKEELRIRFHRR